MDRFQASTTLENEANPPCRCHETARLVLLGATRLHTVFEEGLDHFAIAMADRKDNEFDIY